MAKISLQEITVEIRDAILDLSVSETQRKFVADNEKTLRQAAEAPEAWLRAVFADEVPVGLVLLHDEHLRASPREMGYYFLWRLMIDADQQGNGYGRRAVELVVEYLKTRPHAKRLLSSYVPGDDGPAEFYQRCGFRPTGKIYEGEVEIELPLS